MRFSAAIIIIIISSHFLFATMMISVCAIGRPTYTTPSQDSLSNFWGSHPDASTGPWRFRPSSGGRGYCSCTPPPPPEFPYSWRSHPPPPFPKVIVVGGKDKWRFGTNYTDWAIKAVGSFYVEDVLEFDFPLPAVDGRPSRNHSVVLLKDRKSFERCDLSGSLRIANEYAGGTLGGFKFQLAMKRDPFYYFACGEGNGDHCDKGTMKFAVMPLLS